MLILNFNRTLYRLLLLLSFTKVPVVHLFRDTCIEVCPEAREGRGMSSWCQQLAAMERPPVVSPLLEETFALKHTATTKETLPTNLYVLCVWKRQKLDVVLLWPLQLSPTVGLVCPGKCATVAKSIWSRCWKWTGKGDNFSLNAL